MAKKRYTVTDLRDDIEELNEQLANCGSRKRLVEQGRNNYQAVDAYSVDANGNRIGSSVDCNVRCGTSRECCKAARSFYYNEYNRIGKENNFWNYYTRRGDRKYI